MLALVLCTTRAWTHAQLKDIDPDWKENDVQAIPAFDVSRLIEIDMGRRFSLVYAIDPQTLSVGSDGILRYVMVARSASGVVNAFYEGLRCSTAEGRVYARHNPSSGWQSASASVWQPLRETTGMLHVLRFARQGGCDGAAPQRSARIVIDQLKSGLADRYR
jgi:hypothetical protein